ncbi:MAG TPA: hypothetical protein PLN48_03245 [Lachnospiraceae bacterium]|nr:hypothetical protein [Lachnospiraceae bacterium]
MKSIFRKSVAAALAIILTGASLTGCGAAKIDGTKTVVTINDEKVDLGVLAFLTKYEQAQIYSYYSSYFGGSGMFDTVENESTQSTYGDTMKSEILDQLEQWVLLRQHAADYNVSLTDEDNSKIAEVAQKYIDNNSEELRAKIGASKDDVIEALDLQTIRSKMLDPMAADVDTNVTDEEAQQTSVTYVQIKLASDTDSSTTTASGTESTATVEEQNTQKMTDAENILSEIQASGDIANADIKTIATGVNSDYTTSAGQFTTNDTTDTSLDSSIVEAVSGLSDGTLVDHVITSSDEKYYYIVRLDKNFDTDKTTEKKASLLKTRKQDNFDSIVEGWKSSATITVDQNVLGTLKVTDSDPYTLAAESTASTADTSVTADTVSSDTASVAADSTASSDTASVS